MFYSKKKTKLGYMSEQEIAPALGHLLVSSAVFISLQKLVASCFQSFKIH